MTMTMRPGAAALAAALIALGILGLGNGDFAMVWQPVPPWIPGREARPPADRFHWTGLAVSWTLTAAAWAVAETYLQADSSITADRQIVDSR